MNIDKRILTLGKVPGIWNKGLDKKKIYKRENGFRQVKTPTEFMVKTAGFKGRKSCCEPGKGLEKNMGLPGTIFGEKNSVSYNRSKIGVSDFYSINGNLLLGCTESTEFQKSNRLSSLSSLRISNIKSVNPRKREIKIPKFIFEVKKIKYGARTSRKTNYNKESS